MKVSGPPLLDTVLDTMPAGLFTLDRGARISSWNRQMEILTGYAAEEALGQSCTILRTVSDPPCSPGSGDCVLALRSSIREKRVLIRHKDGTSIPVLKNAKPLKDSRGRVVGAVEVLTDLRLLERLEEEIARLRLLADRGGERSPHLLGHHPRMLAVLEQIALAARTPCSVLIQGETGTGKELVARAIHDLSDRHDGPFIRVACGAIPETLLESEMFGHVRGAFTGAIQDRIGRFQAAHGGTIFLDEIGDVSPAVQVKLLRVLQEREFERLGDSRTIRVDVRILAATHRDLRSLVDGGAFREDLYYRLAVFPLEVPPLRERKEDIPLLVAAFLEQVAARSGRPVSPPSPAAMERLMLHSWPGNVRELENAVEYATILARGGPIEVSHLPPHLGAPGGGPPPVSRGRRPRDLETIRRVFRETGGNRNETARRLGVHRVTLWKWMRAHASEFLEDLQEPR